jgi:putative MATE family efflux protein
VIAGAGWIAAPALIGAFGPDPLVAAEAETYLRISLLALPAMLVIFAGTGLLRGLQDTVTPLWIVGFGFAGNAALNGVLIYLLGLGVAGAAIGSVVVQWGMTAVFCVVVTRLARRHAATLRPHGAGMRAAAHAGGWLLVRTAALRVAFVTSVVVATGMGRDELAGYQIVITLFNVAALALDALAIAAQALVGRHLGAGDAELVRAVLRRCLLWGVGFGVVVGLLVGAGSGVIGLAFTGSTEIARLVQPALLLLAVAQPLAAIVFVLDGVLIGAGDVRYLAVTGLVNLACFLPLAVAVAQTGVDGTAGLAWLAAALFVGYLSARLATLAWRSRGERWIVVGATR